MPEEQFKRNVAYKFRIEDLSRGRPVFENERFIHLDVDGKKVSRVNIVGSIVEKFENNGEKKYTFITLDDGSGQIKLKAFGEDADKLNTTSHGQTVVVIGTLRQFNDEVYIFPEIIKEQSPKYLIVRKIEIEKSRPKISSEQTSATTTHEVNEKTPENQSLSNENLRESVQEEIKNAESDGGIEIESLISKLGHAAETIQKEVQDLLEEGVVFEPRPGKVRWLG